MAVFPLLSSAMVKIVAVMVKNNFVVLHFASTVKMKLNPIHIKEETWHDWACKS